MKGIFSISAVLFLIHAAYAQKEITPQKPDEEIIVNKEYDEHGNLLRYDSTYSFQWRSDTTFSFPDFGGWQDMFSNAFPFRDMFTDSLFHDMPFFRDFPSRFFEEDSVDHPFPFGFDPFTSDSSFLRRFSFQFDTTLFMGPDSSFLLPPGFIIPEMNSLKDLLKEFGENQDSDPFSPFFYRQIPPGTDRFPDLEQQKEWDALIERHQREMEELRKKWEKMEEKKIY